MTALQLLNRGAAVNHMALSRVGSSADGTTALHACAAMRSAGWSSEQAFYETARVLMLAGGNPFQENLSGVHHPMLFNSTQSAQKKANMKPFHLLWQMATMIEKFST